MLEVSKPTAVSFFHKISDNIKLFSIGPSRRIIFLLTGIYGAGVPFPSAGWLDNRHRVTLRGKVLAGNPGEVSRGQGLDPLRVKPPVFITNTIELV